MTWARDKSHFLAVIKALKASMPPYNIEYRGGLRPSRIAGRWFSASSSQVVTCATMSLTDHAFVTPGTRRTDSGKPAYESLNASHSLSSCLKSRCLLSTFVDFDKPRRLPDFDFLVFDECMASANRRVILRRGKSLRSCGGDPSASG